MEEVSPEILDLNDLDSPGAVCVLHFVFTKPLLFNLILWPLKHNFITKNHHKLNPNYHKLFLPENASNGP